MTGHDAELLCAAERGRRAACPIGRTVITVVVDQYERERRIVLAQQRRDALRDVLGLVARRHHDDDRRRDRGERDIRVVTFAAEPKSPAREHEEYPACKCECCEGNGNHCGSH